MPSVSSRAPGRRADRSRTTQPGPRRADRCNGPSSAFEQDEVGDWVAWLECGHRQHVRHQPPWQERCLGPHAPRGARDAGPAHRSQCRACAEEGNVDTAGGDPACWAHAGLPGLRRPGRAPSRVSGQAVLSAPIATDPRAVHPLPSSVLDSAVVVNQIGRVSSVTVRQWLPRGPVTLGLPRRRTRATSGMVRDGPVGTSGNTTGATDPSHFPWKKDLDASKISNNWLIVCRFSMGGGNAEK